MTAKFSKSKFLLWAFVLWTVWVVFYAIIMDLQLADVNFPIALISSANFNYIFAFISVLIWKICKRLPFDKFPVALLSFLHFILAILFSVLWISVVFGLWILVQGIEVLELVQIETFLGWQILFGMIMYFFTAGVFYTIIYYRSLKKQQLQEAELKILTRDAELKALKLQMNPHFLFNSLNSINALVTKDPTLARKMITGLSELLRVTLENKDKLIVSLKEELELVHKYIAIEQIRFQDKMEYIEDVDTKLLTKPFPAMLLQPLIENAVKHGIAESRTGGTIELTMQQRDSRIQGIVQNQVAAVDPAHRNNNNDIGSGINNILQRLDRLYGKKYSWEIESGDPKVYKIKFEIPIHYHEEN